MAYLLAVYMQGPVLLLLRFIYSAVMFKCQNNKENISKHAEYQ